MAALVPQFGDAGPLERLVPLCLALVCSGRFKRLALVALASKGVVDVENADQGPRLLISRGSNALVAEALLPGARRSNQGTDDVAVLNAEALHLRERHVNAALWAVRFRRKPARLLSRIFHWTQKAMTALISLEATSPFPDAFAHHFLALLANIHFLANFGARTVLFDNAKQRPRGFVLEAIGVPLGVVLQLLGNRPGWTHHGLHDVSVLEAEAHDLGKRDVCAASVGAVHSHLHARIPMEPP
mmetsp:Transcript_112650/g.318222  ORF Transcript_112650/g.318222 Transcript_112650/m.318222 type:complete len:243 (-) Transcript_112650:601-1329(-)